MPKIKTKEIIKGTIKSIDKSAVALEKTKDVLVDVKKKSENAYNGYDNVNDYSSNKIESISNRAIDEINKKGKKSVIDTKQNVNKTKTKINMMKSKLTEKRMKKKSSITNSGNIIKNITKQKERFKTKKLIQETARKTTYVIKKVFKTTFLSVKAIILGTKALILALIAGGWIALLIIILICLVVFLCSSIFGIFFSNENKSNNITISSVVSEINKEMSDKIINLQQTNRHDDYKLISNRAEWKEVLSLYVAKISNGNNTNEVITMDEKRKNELKKIFWDMHKITYEIKKEKGDELIFKDPISIEEKEVLYIKITSKSLEEMMNLYNFTNIQKKQVEDLLNEKFSMMWSSVIFGTPIGSSDMVQIALSQVGNIGGEIYWRWYGFNSRVEWCAVFVSWVANQVGYIEKGIIPKFVGCDTGVNWFKLMGKWKEKEYIPKPGDIIFFDWDDNGSANHVGIVEKVENNIVYTIEGNSTDDMCRQKEYSINSDFILGYGIL